MRIGRLENPIHSMEWNAQIRSSGAEGEWVPGGGSGSHQLDRLWMVWPQNDARVGSSRISSHVSDRPRDGVTGSAHSSALGCAGRREVAGRVGPPPSAGRQQGEGGKEK